MKIPARLVETKVIYLRTGEDYKSKQKQFALRAFAKKSKEIMVWSSSA